jgi:transposase-like protein
MKKRTKNFRKSKIGKTVTVDRRFFTDHEKELIIQDYLNSGLTKQEIWKKYTGRAVEHGAMLRWMREFGYDSRIPINYYKFGKNFPLMVNKKKSIKPEDDFEILKLKKRVAELEKQLQEAEMKSIAYSTMVDIAEKQFNIPIRKKYNTKPSKK